MNLKAGNHLFRGPAQLLWNSKSQTSHIWQNCLIWSQWSIKGPIILLLFKVQWSSLEVCNPKASAELQNAALVEPFLKHVYLEQETLP